MSRVCRRGKTLFIVLAVCAGVAAWRPKIVGAEGCAQPVSSGTLVTATDCLFILNVAVGVTSCKDPCECAPKGTLPTSATDALLCLNAATGQPTSLLCPCHGATSTTTTSTDTTTTTSTTLAACAGLGDSGYLDGMTEAHNDVRSSATPVPDPALAALCWSESVAAVAQAWADNCTWQHNPGRGFLGENIFAGSGNWLSSAALSAVNLWAAEAAYYDYETNACASGEVCGHYTQIVWRSSEKVGCGITLCNTGSPFGGGAWTFVVCNYDPPGNWVGQKPY